VVIPSFYTSDGNASCTGALQKQHGACELASYAPEFPGTTVKGKKTAQRQTAAWRESEIVTNLFLGDVQDAGRFDGMIVSVLSEAMADEAKRTIHIPFLANGRATLDTTSALIDAGLRLGMPVLVHCEEGCERAPLVVAWFLKTRRGMTLDEAYELIKSRRPIVKDRRAWLGIYNR
jgi:protein-tyrosine phosphatase